MNDIPSQDRVLLDPEYWWAWLVVGTLGLALTLGIAMLLGITSSDVLLLRNGALGLFTIFDYVLIGYGVAQGIRKWLMPNRGNPSAKDEHAL